MLNTRRFYGTKHFPAWETKNMSRHAFKTETLIREMLMDKVGEQDFLDSLSTRIPAQIYLYYYHLFIPEKCFPQITVRMYETINKHGFRNVEFEHYTKQKEFLQTLSTLGD